MSGMLNSHNDSTHIGGFPYGHKGTAIFPDGGQGGNLYKGCRNTPYDPAAPFQTIKESENGKDKSGAGIF